MSDLYMPSEHRRPHVNSDTCGKCRKRFGMGDRVMQAMIFAGAGRHPQNMVTMGAYLEEEFELVHVDCRDPLLVKGYE